MIMRIRLRMGLDPWPFGGTFTGIEIDIWGRAFKLLLLLLVEGGDCISCKRFGVGGADIGIPPAVGTLGPLAMGLPIWIPFIIPPFPRSGPVKGEIGDESDTEPAAKLCLRMTAAAAADTEGPEEDAPDMRPSSPADESSLPLIAFAAVAAPDVAI